MRRFPQKQLSKRNGVHLAVAMEKPGDDQQQRIRRQTQREQNELMTWREVPLSKQHRHHAD
jgi:hypothetical protein